MRDGILVPTTGRRGDDLRGKVPEQLVYADGTYSTLKHYEVDDLGRRFNGNGLEIALRQHFTARLWIEGTYNGLSPNSAHPRDFRIRFGAKNIVYNFNIASRLFFGFKLEGSRRSDRTGFTESTLPPASTTPSSEATASLAEAGHYVLNVSFVERRRERQDPPAGCGTA